MSTTDNQEVDVLALIDELDELLSNAKPVPLSDQLRVERQRVYALLDGVRASLPDTVTQSRSIVKQRKELLAGTLRECERLLEDARARAARETSDSVVRRLAERQAALLVTEARRAAYEQRLEMDEWADDILATLGPNFEQFLQVTRRGREGLLQDRSTRESIIDSNAP